MLFRLLAVAVLVCTLSITSAQSSTLQERLGYTKDTKLLIVHADDLGVSQSENAASIAAMEKGSVRSASIMVPCPWMGDMAAYARSHPNADLGLHLTLTSEWKNYKWGTLTPSSKVSSLVNLNGYLYSDTDSLYANARLDDIETEIRSQIEKARSFGIDATHFDAHMGCLFITPTYLQLLIKLGREYKVPVLLNEEAFNAMYNLDIHQYISEKEVVVDKVFMLQPVDYKNGAAVYYNKVLKSLQPGLSCILLHAAFDNAEMKAITVDHPDYGAAWRQADYNYFTSDSCKKLLAAYQIKVITWREIRDKLFR
jgi:chitin disaccharide deacetylase